MQFPIYRRYANFDSYFVVTSPDTWTEYKRLGKKFLKFDFTAQQFPEKLFIQDLIQLAEGIEPATKAEIPTMA